MTKLPITNGTLFAYVMNNCWFTNYKAGQDGRFEFRYRLTSDEAIDRATAARFGESAVQPLRAIRLRPGPEKGDLPATKSFCRVEPASVQLTAVKVADDGRGIIVRLRETTGKPTTATLSSSFLGVREAVRCDLVERNQIPLPMTGGQVTLELAPEGMATIRFR